MNTNNELTFNQATMKLAECVNKIATPENTSFTYNEARMILAFQKIFGKCTALARIKLGAGMNPEEWDAYCSKRFRWDSMKHLHFEVILNKWMDLYVSPNDIASLPEIFEIRDTFEQQYLQGVSIPNRRRKIRKQGFYEFMQDSSREFRQHGCSCHTIASASYICPNWFMTAGSSNITSQSNLSEISLSSFNSSPRNRIKSLLAMEDYKDPFTIPQSGIYPEATQADHDMINLLVIIHIAISTGCCDHDYSLPQWMVQEFLERYPLVTWVYGLFEGGTYKLYDRIIFLQDYFRISLRNDVSRIDKFFENVFGLMDGFDETFSERYRAVNDMENIIYALAHKYGINVEGTIFPLSREQLIRLGYDHSNHCTEPQSGINSVFEEFKTFLDQRQPKIDEEQEPEMSNFSFMKEAFKEYRKGTISEDLKRFETITDDIRQIIVNTPNLPFQQANELVDKLTNLVENFTKKNDEQKESVEKRNSFVWYIALFALIILYVKFKNKLYLVAASAITGYLLSTTNFKDIFSKILKGTGLWEKLLEFFTSLLTTKTEPQISISAFDDTIKLFGSVFTLFILKDTPMEKRYEEIYRKISTWDRFTNNLTSVIKLLIESVQTIVNYTLELCGKENKGASYARWLDTNNYQIDEFLKKVDVIEEEFHSGNLKVCQAELQRANHLRDEGRRLIKSLGRTPVPRPMLQCMTSLETIIKKLCTSSSAALGNRVEPVFILFIGPPGIGKSKVSRSIAHYLVAKSLHTEKEKELFVQDSNQYIYYRKIGNEHWEGYEPTMKAVIYDDISQMVDIAGGMYSEYLELIHLINSETYNLNMAFELKGKMFAGPDWVFGSTNSVTPNIQSINEHDAYYRRAKHSFYAVPKPEYTTEETKHEAFGKRKVDFSKLPVVGDVTDFGKDILEFHKVSYPSTGNYKFTGEVFNYEQICQYAMEQLEFNRKVYEKECADLKAERQRALDEYRQDTVPQSNVQFEHQDDIMQGIYDLPHVDYDDDAQEDYLPENWTEVEHNAVSNFLKSVERGNPKALQFMFILTKYYIAINTAMFQFVPTNEEVVTSYTVKFGEKFILLLTDLDIDILKDYCFKMVALGCTFDRRYRDICLPFKGYSYWKRVKSKFTNVKEHIWRKYIQGTFIEGLWVVMGYFAKQNEMYLWIMCGASIFQILLSYTTSKIISPVYEKIAHHSNEIALSLEVVHEISKRDPEEAQLIYEMLEMDSEFLAIMSDDSIDIMQKKDYILKSLQLKQYTRSLKPAEIQDLNEEVKQELRNEVEPQYGRKTSKTNRIKSKVVIKTNAVPQMSYGIDNNGNNIMRKVINSNSYELFIQEDHLEMGLKKVGSIVFVRGHIALHPEHYILQIQKIWRGCKKLGYDYGETFMELRQQNEYYTRAYKAKMKDIFDFKNNDLQAYYFPIPRCDDLVLSKIRMPNKGSSANIVKYFCTKNEFDVCSYETPGSLICVDGRAVKIAPVIAQRKHVNVDYKAAEENFSLVNTFSYNAPTEPGDCGGLLALNKPHLSTSRIYGMHVARSDDWQLSHAECPFREAIEVLLEHFDKEDVVIYDFDDNVTFTQAQCGIGQFQVLGQIDPKQPISSKSNIKKSVLFDRLPIPVTEVPARLAPVLFDGEVTDPWNHNIKKYCTNTAVYIDPKHVKMICQQMLIDLKNASFLNVDKDVLTMEEAVLGEDRFDLGSVPRNTSPGYPYTTEPVPGLPKRYRFFGNDPLTYDLDNPYYRKLEDRVAYVIEQAMNNTRCLHYSCDNLKDECIDIDKVLNKLKTRVYNNFPVDKLIVDKMYYGAFCSWLAKNKVDNNFAIGVNPYSEDWDAIARKLLCFGSTILRNIGSGDYSCFDGSEPFEIMDGIHEYIICAWYEDPDGNQVRKILFMDIVDSVHIRGGLVYKWEGGNTSGNFLTAPLNCLVNMFNFYYAWLRLHNFDYSSLKNFKRFISCIFLGDDNGFSVHPMYKELFTEFYLSEALKEIGFTYTSELKDTVNEKMRSITEIEFLKRKFIKDSALGRWMGALRIDSSMQGLYWTSKEPEKFTMVTKEKVDTVLKELSIHGREFFEYNAGFINYATEKYMNYISDFSTFELAYAAVLDSEYTY